MNKQVCILLVCLWFCLFKGLCFNAVTGGFSNFQMIHLKQVSGTFETVSGSSAVDCAAACLQNARTTGTCVSTNYNSGSQTCGLSISDGTTLYNTADDQDFTLIPLNCGSFVNPYRNTEVVTPATCTTEGCTVDVKCRLGFKQPDESTGPFQIVCTRPSVWMGSPVDPDCTYELMFRGTAENGYNISAAYKMSADPGVTSDVGCMDVHNTSCTFHYRNSRLDSWSSLGITNIRYQLYSGGNTVISVDLNGTGSDMLTWMGNDAAFKATAWPWTDMTPVTTSWWSLFNDVGPGRVFRILQKYKGNCRDWYYSVVLFEPSYGCNYESFPTWPRFLYTNHTDAINFKQGGYLEASSMAVWVQHTS